MCVWGGGGGNGLQKTWCVTHRDLINMATRDGDYIPEQEEDEEMKGESVSRKSKVHQHCTIITYDETSKKKYFGCEARLLFKYFGCKARLLFNHYGCEAILLFKLCGTKKDFCSNILGAKQDICSNLLGAKQDFRSKNLDAKEDF